MAGCVPEKKVGFSLRNSSIEGFVRSVDLLKILSNVEIFFFVFEPLRDSYLRCSKRNRGILET